MAEPSALIAIKTAASLYRLAENEGFIDKIKNFFKRKETIIVLGSTGSGKTNLLESLAVAAGLVEAIPANTRTQSVDKRKVIVNERPFVIADTPGQAQHAPHRQTLIREALANPPVRIINVVSYGYHEYATGSAEAVEQGMPRESWLERHRENELEAMSEWLPLLGDRGTTSWILTAVTKADLWWNQREDVLRYYNCGPYAEMLNRQDPGMRHAVLPYCSVFHRFYGTAALAGTFDDEDRLQATGHFLQELVALG